MNKSAIISGLIGSIIISSIAGGLVGYYLLPVLLGERTTSGQALGTEYREIQTQAILLDSDSVESMIPNTQLTIATSGSSYLLIKFSTPYTIHLSSSFVNAFRVNISVKVDDSLIKFVRIGKYQESSVGFAQEYTSELYIECITPVLNAGIHNVSLHWYSYFDNAGSNQLIFNNVVVNFTRTIYVQERGI